jgi:pimeloyl-ACP methyl ester carboxylesterase
MLVRNRSVLFATVSLLMISPWRPALAAPSYWGNLTPGPYAVGFRSLWQLDYSRVYNTVFDDKTMYSSGKAPRPILINIWYPAEGANEIQPMPHGDYLKILTEDPRLARFATKLADYERGIACKEVMGKTASELTEHERAQFERTWTTPTACRRDAPAIDARFPLVIYHSGAQSSIEDNAAFCEFLASHGYVVVGSAFEEVTGHTLAVDGRNGSARDLEFLIAHARRQQNVDWQKIGLAGHSLGAQAILMFRAQDASPVDALIALDTTQDYASLVTPGWDDMTKLVLENARNFNCPLLMVANSYAFFELADSLKSADRLYLTLREHDHNDFIAQGILKRSLLCEAKPEDRDLRSALRTARTGYEAVCTFALDFFNVHLKNQTERREHLLKKHGKTTLGGDQPHVDHVPVGVTGPEPFRDDQVDPPSPRQIRRIVTARGLDATLTLLKHWYDKAPQAPVFHRDFGFEMIEEWLKRDRTAEAIAINRFYGSLDKAFSQMFVKRGDHYTRFGAMKGARKYYEKALLLDPSDATAAQRLKERDEPSKGSK